MARNARMTDVAKLAGVSTMTVSRVLNDSANVTGELRAQVLSAIEKLRYQPNELARSLRDRRSRQIGVVLPYLYDPFFASCAHVISTVAKQHAYSVVLSTSNEDPQTEYEEASRMLRRNVEGLIVIPAQVTSGKSLLLGHEFDRMPIVSFDRPVEGSGFDSVLVENEQGARMGTEHLLKLGHQRVTYVGFADALYTMSMRHRGYEAAIREAGQKAHALLFKSDMHDAVKAISRLMNSRQRPTALFCGNNLVTRHVLHSLQALNIHPPDGVALVGFDDFETADLLRPGITVVRQPIELLGQTAADILFRSLEGDPALRVKESKVLPVELVVRGSCGAIAQTSLR